MAQAPRTRYAKCGDLDIAYQVFGEGPVDLVILPGPMIPIDSIDAEPSLYRFHHLIDEPPARWLAAQLPLASTVLKVGHHGSAYSTSTPSPA